MKRDMETDRIRYHEIGATFTEELGIKKHKRERTEAIVKGINRIILSRLATSKSHLESIL
jgi:hypothetical protein